ncbi:hypothetical protein QT971_05220 [Microcoleus sp. herbarium19]|uniref:hypothetical protein n=1 Tax=unclassified Microcoleus TaxID=2642155 RepID=UPI002FD1D56A
MSQHFSAKDGQLFANLPRAAIALSALEELNPAWAECIRSLLEDIDDDLKQEKFELQQEINHLKPEKLKLQQEIGDLRRELESNYCDNDGSPNCKLSRSRICYG